MRSENTTKIGLNAVKLPKLTRAQQ